MAVLKAYVRDNDKSGYYVQASVSGLDHPVTLQCPPITERIYEELGFQPVERGRGGGVDVPGRLTWLLYDVGLHWTASTGDEESLAEQGSVSSGASNTVEMDEAHVDRILSLVDGYTGEYSEAVRDLRRTLGEGAQTDTSQVTFPPVVERRLDEWEPSSVVDGDHERTFEGDGEFRVGRVQYRRQLSSVPNLTSLIETYEAHPWPVSSVSSVDSSEDDNLRSLCVFFENDETSVDQYTPSVLDHRYVENDHDFSFDLRKREKMIFFYISSSKIVDVAVFSDDGPLILSDIVAGEWDGVEDHERSTSQLINDLVVDLGSAVPVVHDFFDGIPDYELETDGVRG